MSQFLFRSLRNSPAEADTEGHALLLRGGYVRPLGPGLLTSTPLGLRVLRRIARVMSQEMEALGLLEVNTPLVQPASLWRESGRWDHMGADMARFTDRAGRELCLATTHEEAFTDLARGMVDSWKQLPLALFQIQTKFRDEPRPRGGLLRVREFMMKDAYSFHATAEDLEQFYSRMKEAYLRIFRRCGLDVRVVEGHSGMMGGHTAHEFAALLPIGEDTVLICDACGHHVNVQVARSRKQSPPPQAQEPLRELDTPEVRTISDLAADIALAASGDGCINCGATLRSEKAVEVGNIFQLGTRYSDAMNAGFRDADGEWKPFVMGSYGIGPGRVMASIAESHRDEAGPIWPSAVAPFDAVITSLDSDSTGEVAAAAEQLYERLRKAGNDVLLDDREERAGVKFADADLIGAPVRITVGSEGLKDGLITLKVRRSGDTHTLAIDDSEAISRFLSPN